MGVVSARYSKAGVYTNGEQAISEGGYCLTSFGREWLKTVNRADFVLLEPGALGQVLAGYRTRFGDGYYQRSQEAIRCRRAEAWLACYAMVGAASESILLKLATVKTGNEENVLNIYGRRDGRRNVIKLLTGKASNNLANSLNTFMGLLGYWRDDAAHGQLSAIEIANADEALRQLLHLSQWADKNWDQLIAN